MEGDQLVRVRERLIQCLVRSGDLAGARAVQVGTATLADPRAPARVLAELRQILDSEGVASLAEIVGAAK